jgi:hypothetical protein
MPATQSDFIDGQKIAKRRAAQYRRLLAASARDLGVKIGDERAANLATLRWTVRTVRESMQQKLLAGQAVSPDVLLRLEESLRGHLPAAAEPPSMLTLKISRKRFEICQRCGYQHPVDADVSAPTHAAPAATLDAENARARGSNKTRKRKSAAPKPSDNRKSIAAAQNPAEISTAANRKSIANVVPLRKPRSIHDGPYAALKQPDITRDENLGGFVQSAEQRDPHRRDETLPVPRGDAS